MTAFWGREEEGGVGSQKTLGGGKSDLQPKRSYGGEE